ncbi:type I phosphomannose isomerase catalytic subunit [Effusibacillus lacus]|uniref:Mannose-6-phosphate isomerase n=1 Tax=Effusibacillus lacus TaxID=1348429 RepID=A0A292YEM3_9BACL|nr:type I phosphomannose isomerase catalytic subunit [Effusibacillus lacus]GAX91752.1 mannose-6-phosphate isomerase [Effusibacillus lacus]
MFAYPVKFAPIAQARIWGGKKLKEWFSEKQEGPIGEYWVLSGHPKATSVVVNGPFAGNTLVQLTGEFPEAYLGKSPQDRFPLLIKFLEATDDLSVQIHPNDEYARQNEGDFGKTEAWYILDAKEDARIIYGHTFPSRDEYVLAVKEKRVPEFLRYKPIEKDQLIFVPSRTLHALLAGTILIEIQQTSDVTYRVYDWDRVDDQGRGRELHIEKAADVMIYGEPAGTDGVDTNRRTLFENGHVVHQHLVTCPYFVIEKLTIKVSAHQINLGKQGNPDIIIIANGEGVLDPVVDFEPIELKYGDTVLVPSTISEYQIRTTSKIELLRTYY